MNTIKYNNSNSKKLLLLVGHDTHHDFFQNIDPMTRELAENGQPSNLGGGAFMSTIQEEEEDGTSTPGLPSKVPQQNFGFQPQVSNTPGPQSSSDQSSMLIEKYDDDGDGKLSQPELDQAISLSRGRSRGRSSVAQRSNLGKRSTSTEGEDPVLRRERTSQPPSGLSVLRSGQTRTIQTHESGKKDIKYMKIQDFEERGRVGRVNPEYDFEYNAEYEDNYLELVEMIDKDDDLLYENFTDDSNSNMFTFFEIENTKDIITSYEKHRAEIFQRMPDAIREEERARVVVRDKVLEGLMAEGWTVDEGGWNEVDDFEEEYDILDLTESVQGGGASGIIMRLNRLVVLRNSYREQIKKIKCIENIFMYINNWNILVYNILNLSLPQFTDIKNLNDDIISASRESGGTTSLYEDCIIRGFFDWFSLQPQPPPGVLVDILSRIKDQKKTFLEALDATSASVTTDGDIVRKLYEYQYFNFYYLFKDAIEKIKDSLEPINDDDDDIDVEVGAMWRKSIDNVSKMIDEIFKIFKGFIKYTSSANIKIGDKIDVKIDLDNFIKKKWYMLAKKIQGQGLADRLDTFFKERVANQNSKLTLSLRDNNSVNNLRFLIMTYWAQLSGYQTRPIPDQSGSTEDDWSNRQYYRMSKEKGDNCLLEETISDEKLRKDFFNEYSRSGSMGVNLTQPGFYKLEGNKLNDLQEIQTSSNDIAEILTITRDAYNRQNCGNNGSAVKLYMADRDQETRKLTALQKKKAKIHGNRTPALFDFVEQYNCTLPGVADPCRSTCNECRTESGIGPSCSLNFDCTTELEGIGHITLNMEKGSRNDLQNGLINYEMSINGVILKQQSNRSQTASAAAGGFQMPRIGKLYDSGSREKLLEKTSVLRLVMEYIDTWNTTRGTSAVSKSDKLANFVTAQCRIFHSTNGNHVLNDSAIKDIISLFNLKTFGDMSQELYATLKWKNGFKTVYFGNDWISYIRFLFLLFNLEDYRIPMARFWCAFLGNNSFHIIYYLGQGGQGGGIKKSKRKSKKSKRKSKEKRKTFKKKRKSKRNS